MIWKPIPGFSHYEASDTGLVRIVKRTARNGKLGVIKLTVKSNGYVYATMLADDGTRKARLIHRLVTLTFKGPPPSPEHTHVAHGDKNRSNNHVWNLRWATPPENAGDRVGHGTNPDGEKNPAAVLTEADVLLIMASTETCVALGKQYGVSHRTISAVRTGYTWNHVTGLPRTR